MAHVENDTSSSDSESVGNDEISNLLEQTRLKLETNPYDYATHVELISLYRQAGDLDGARLARSNMADVFPLEEKLWLEWLKDEMTLITIPAAVKEISSLFERAVQDYLSVSIWLEYVQFAIDSMSDGFDYPRDIFEKAIVSAGLHTSQGSLIWNAYREFEKAIFHSLQEMQHNDPDNIDLKSEVEAQYERIAKLYKRQLSVPLIGHEDTFQEYQSFCEAIINEDSLPNYTRATGRLKVLLPFEEQLLEQSTSELYQRYIDKLIESKEEPTLINTLYQRAVAAFPLNTDLWNHYLKYLATNFLNVKPVILKGHEQSVRNCPWVSSYWIKYTSTQERLEESHETIVATYEKAVGDNFADSDSYLQVWTAYCDYLHRLARRDISGEEEKVKLRNLFVRAKEHLKTNFQRQGDHHDTLSQYQASVEARCYSNMEETRLLWTDIMTRHGNQAQYWLDYIELERMYGDLSNCRKLFLMSVNSVSDDPERVCAAFLQFEREQGTLESFEVASRKCSIQLDRIKERRDKANEKSKENRKQRKGLTATGQQQSTQKLKVSPARTKSGKKRKMEVPSEVFFTESDEGEKSQKMMKIEEDEPTATDVGESGKVKVEEAVLGWLSTEKEATHGRKPRGPDENTVFVSNLSFDVTQEQLGDFFSQCGNVVDVRLIKTRGGRGKPNIYAYVEYSSSEPISQALLLDHSQLNDRCIYVSSCVSATTKQSKYNDKATVFVTNVAHDLTENQLQEVFQEAGKIKGVRLVRNKQGRSKGFAYIEYISESSAKAAVLSLDGREMGGKGIKVAMSNPPSAKAPRSSFYSELERKGSLKDTPPIRRTTMSMKPKTNLSLVPRALACKTSMSEKTSCPEEVTIQKKSNEDFRKLLFKKE